MFRPSLIHLLLLVLAGVPLVVTDQYPLCEDTTSTGTLNNVVVTDCSPSTRCTIRAGSQLHVEIEFTPVRDSDSLTISMHGILTGLPIPLPFPGFDNDGCNAAYGIECPLRAFRLYKYTVTVQVPTSMLTPYNVQAKIELKDDNEDTIVCFTDHLRIVG